MPICGRRILAQNPLWSSALRLLGQFLLREPAGGTTAWDAALAAARARDDKPTMDILLEALCLDPQASSFLEERAALLLEHEGALLERLLRRFLHTATVPRFPPGAFKVDASLGLYLEASLRNPIIGRWPAMARSHPVFTLRLGRSRTFSPLSTPRPGRRVR